MAFDFEEQNMAGQKENCDPDLSDFQLPKRKKAKHDDHFASAKDTDEIAKITRGFVPPNAAKSTVWAMRVFHEWCFARNKKTTSETCPKDLLNSPDITNLNFWIPRFVAEVRRQ